jgi:hypothetical protein
MLRSGILNTRLRYFPVLQNEILYSLVDMLRYIYLNSSGFLL